jgi:hypothetical protein
MTTTRRYLVPASDTVPNTDTPVDSAVRNLRVCRGYMLGCASTLDAAGESEAVHSLRLSLTTLDDCLGALEPPEQPTRVIPIRGDSIADDRRDDLMADADRSEYR